MASHSSVGLMTPKDNLLWIYNGVTGHINKFPVEHGNEARGTWVLIIRERKLCVWIQKLYILFCQMMAKKLYFYVCHYHLYKNGLQESRNALQFLIHVLFLLALAPELPIYERRNWLIHLHYVRKDIESCKVSS